MNRFFKILTITLAVVTFNLTLNAQNNRQRISREELAKTQAKHIATELAFDEATTAKFTETYCNYQEEIWNLGPRIRKNDGAKQTSSAEQESEEEIKAKFEQSQKILDIRKKYYNEYSKFLTQKQIQRVYEIEKDIMKRLSKHGSKDKGRRGLQ